MTEVFYKRDGNSFDIVFSGHANYDEFGKDIVCSAISAAANFIIDGLAGEGCYIEYYYSLKPGNVRIRAEAKNKRGRWLCGALYGAAVNTLHRIAEKYPENLFVSD